MTRLSREIERRLDKFVALRRQHLIIIEALIREVAGDDTPETYVIESDGVPIESPQPFTRMSRNLVWLEESAARVPIDLDVADRIRSFVRNGRFNEASQEAQTFELTSLQDAHTHEALSMKFTDPEPGAPLTNGNFLATRRALRFGIQTLCSVGSGHQKVNHLKSDPADAEWVWLAGPYERRNSWGYAVSFSPETRFVVIGKSNGKIGLVDDSGQYLSISEADIVRREPIDAGPMSPFSVIEISAELELQNQYDKHAVERTVVLAYLMGAPVALSARMQVVDRFDPSRPRITVAYRTDGEWIWSHEAASYVDRYDMALPEAFLEHVAKLGGVVPEVDNDRRLDAAETIEGWSSEVTDV